MLLCPQAHLTRNTFNTRLLQLTLMCSALLRVTANRPPKTSSIRHIGSRITMERSQTTTTAITLQLQLRPPPAPLSPMRLSAWIRRKTKKGGFGELYTEDPTPIRWQTGRPWCSQEILCAWHGRLECLVQSIRLLC